MRLLVKLLTGKTVPYDVDASSRVAYLKQRIFEAEGYPVAKQSLVFAGRLLADDVILGDAGLDELAVLHLVVKKDEIAQLQSPASDPIAPADFFPLLSLVPELITHIVLLLPLSSLSNVARTCTALAARVNDPSHWRTRYMQRWGVDKRNSSGKPVNWLQATRQASTFDRALEGRYSYDFEREVLTEHRGPVSALLVDDEVILSGGDDKMMYMHDAVTGAFLHSWKEHSSEIQSLARRGSCLLSGSSDCTVKIWSMHEKKSLRTLTGFKNGAAVIGLSTASDSAIVMDGTGGLHFCGIEADARFPSPLDVPANRIAVSEQRVYCAVGQKVEVLELMHDGHARKAVEIAANGRVGQMQAVGFQCIAVVKDTLFLWDIRNPSRAVRQRTLATGIHALQSNDFEKHVWAAKYGAAYRIDWGQVSNWAGIPGFAYRIYSDNVKALFITAGGVFYHTRTWCGRGANMEANWTEISSSAVTDSQVVLGTQYGSFYRFVPCRKKQ